MLAINLDCTCSVSAWALLEYRQLLALNFASYFSSPEPQQTTAWKGKHATTHPPPRVCGHKIEAWGPRHDENPRNEGPNGNAPNKDVPNDATNGNTPNEDARNEDATYGNAPNGNVTAPNKYPRCGTCIREYPHKPARKTIYEPEGTGPVQDRVPHPHCADFKLDPARTPDYKPAERKPQMTAPQYPTPAAVGVGYYKCKKSSLLARTRTNRQPQTHGTTRRERNPRMTPHKRKPQGGPIQPAVRAGVQGPSTPHPLQQAWGTARTHVNPQPQTRRMTRRKRKPRTSPHERKPAPSRVCQMEPALTGAYEPHPLRRVWWVYAGWPCEDECPAPHPTHTNKSWEGGQWCLLVSEFHKGKGFPIKLEKWLDDDANNDDNIPLIIDRNQVIVYHVQDANSGAGPEGGKNHPPRSCCQHGLDPNCLHANLMAPQVQRGSWLLLNISDREVGSGVQVQSTLVLRNLTILIKLSQPALHNPNCLVLRVAFTLPLDPYPFHLTQFPLFILSSPKLGFSYTPASNPLYHVFEPEKFLKPFLNDSARVLIHNVIYTRPFFATLSNTKKPKRTQKSRFTSRKVAKESAEVEDPQIGARYLRKKRKAIRNGSENSPSDEDELPNTTQKSGPPGVKRRKGNVRITASASTSAPSTSRTNPSVPSKQKPLSQSQIFTSGEPAACNNDVVYGSPSNTTNSATITNLRPLRVLSLGARVSCSYFWRVPPMRLRSPVFDISSDDTPLHHQSDTPSQLLDEVRKINDPLKLLNEAQELDFVCLPSIPEGVLGTSYMYGMPTDVHAILLLCLMVGRTPVRIASTLIAPSITFSKGISFPSCEEMRQVDSLLHLGLWNGIRHAKFSLGCEVTNPSSYSHTRITLSAIEASRNRKPTGTIEVHLKSDMTKMASRNLSKVFIENSDSEDLGPDLVNGTETAAKPATNPSSRLTEPNVGDTVHSYFGTSDNLNWEPGTVTNGNPSLAIGPMNSNFGATDPNLGASTLGSTNPGVVPQNWYAESFNTVLPPVTLDGFDFSRLVFNPDVHNYGCYTKHSEVCPSENLSTMHQVQNKGPLGPLV
ncbi:hypothetical protein BS47DRAFT_1368893 [Hydnum rufescens UP504]|uniref:Uncharacterized protein n=1 Tax=Hydnum rufescens UP504 TaxID=1448309 RepID=A0A9P6AEK4_9AGAM|nr:hypothetical protein BS47DRAFT_1368893 [Hydnum rufescens UP504]